MNKTRCVRKLLLAQRLLNIGEDLQETCEPMGQCIVFTHRSVGKMIRKLEEETNSPAPTIPCDCPDDEEVVSATTEPFTLEDIVLQQEQFFLDGGDGGQSDLRFEW